MHRLPWHARPLSALAALAVVLAPTAAIATQRAPGAAAHKPPRAATPSGLAVVNGRNGASLHWRATDATGFQIEQATTPAMNVGVQRFTIHGDGHQFTPLGLTRGVTYYFKVRTLRGSRHSGYSTQVQLTASKLEQPVEVMTYNILQNTTDGRHEGSGVVAPWAERLPKEVQLIDQAHPDAIAVQEGAKWVGPPGGKRQVDSLRNGLGAPYVLARTEIPPGQPHYFRTGVNILYNNETFKAVGRGNHLTIGNARYAAYQVLANRVTGAKFLFVAAHLLVGFGHGNDLSREAETKTLLKKGNKIAHRRHVPVVFAGDFNSAGPSDRNFTLDGAGIAMRNALVADALSSAVHRTRPTYNSANGYFRRPPHSSDSIDHIFAPPGIGVESAGIELDLRAGRFVGVIPSDHNPVIAGLLYPY
jgi:endonuclease/exonuclease/phosphatase family metal-dependent hydrolase